MAVIDANSYTLLTTVPKMFSNFQQTDTSFGNYIMIDMWRWTANFDFFLLNLILLKNIEPISIFLVY